MLAVLTSEVGFSTDIATLDLTKESDFKLYFSDRMIDFVLAEHVFEHISDSNLELIISNQTIKDIYPDHL
ncbi:MAG: hypothetical protein IPG53_06325 [Ignavibacteriales bacterium]|nr:hypothetical protein [Ignavibacteriales bacterium]